MLAGNSSGCWPLANCLIRSKHKNSFIAANGDRPAHTKLCTLYYYNDRYVHTANTVVLYICMHYSQSNIQGGTTNIHKCYEELIVQVYVWELIEYVGSK